MLTRPELGLRWHRLLPKARMFTAWQYGALGCWLAMAVPLFATRNNAEARKGGA